MELLIDTTAKCEVCTVIQFVNAKGFKPIEIQHRLTEVYSQVVHGCQKCSQAVQRAYI